VSLFDRKNNKLALNSNGRGFYEKISTALDMIDDAVLELSEVTGEMKGEIRLLVSANRRIVTAAIERFKMTYPRVSFLIDHIGKEREYDVILSDDLSLCRGYTATPIITEQILLAISSENQLSKLEFVTAGELEKEESAAKTYILDQVQWYISTGDGNFSFCCKAGHNDEHHNHNDVGHFQTFKGGDEFFADFGAGVYSGPYFGKERYSFIQAGSHGHSVPIVNGQYQKFGKQYAAKDVSFSDNGMIADIAGAYDIPELKKLTRSFVFDKSPAIVHIKDEFELSSDGIPVTERFVSWAKPEIEDGKVTLTRNSGKMSLYFDKDIFEASFEEVDSGKGTVYLTDLTVKEPKANMTFEFEIK
jgi:hypothetical protein